MARADTMAPMIQVIRAPNLLTSSEARGPVRRITPVRMLPTWKTRTISDIEIVRD